MIFAHRAACNRLQWILYPLTALLRTFTTRSVVRPDTIDPLIASPAGHTSEVPCRCHLFSINLCSLARQCCLVSGHSSAVSQLLRNSIRFSAVTVTEYCKIYLSRRESNGNKCECQGRRRRTALWLSK